MSTSVCDACGCVAQSSAQAAEIEAKFHEQEEFAREHGMVR